MEGKKREMETQEGRKSRSEYRMEGGLSESETKKKKNEVKKKKGKKKKKKKKEKRKKRNVLFVWGAKIRGGKMERIKNKRKKKKENNGNENQKGRYSVLVKKTCLDQLCSPYKILQTINLSWISCGKLFANFLFFPFAPTVSPYRFSLASDKI